jgi:DNA-binding NarL/FixJ family response regulator
VRRRGDLYGTRELTPKELRAAELLTAGLKNSEIASVLGTTEYVVKNLNRSIFDKLGMHNRVEVALWYLAHEKTLKGET